MVGEILAVGTALSMIIVASTTGLKGKIGSFEITEETANTAFIEALLKRFAAILGAISPLTK